jgi:hypothetical protein
MDSTSSFLEPTPATINALVRLKRDDATGAIVVTELAAADSPMTALAAISHSPLHP